MIDIQNQTGKRLVLKPIRLVLTQMLAEADRPSVQISVLIADNRVLRQLNNQFRNLDEATDVLTFPAPEHAHSLGDIAISFDFAFAQATKRKVKIQDELAMLAVHGGLHLLGLADETEPDRHAMLARMNDLMASVGLPTEPDWASLPHSASSE